MLTTTFLVESLMMKRVILKKWVNLEVTLNVNDYEINVTINQKKGLNDVKYL